MPLKQLVDKLAMAILEGEYVAGDTVEVDAQDGELIFTKAGKVAAVAE